jgi:hypothetical protein
VFRTALRSLPLRPALFLGALLALGVLTNPSAAAAPVPARPADAFVESVGIVGPFGEAKGVYAENYEALKDVIRELGVRYYRTSAVLPRAAKVAQDFSASLGMKGIFHLSDWDGGKANGVRLGGAAAIIDALTAGGTAGILAFEGPNELNHNGPSDWAKQLRDYQLEIYTHVKSQPRLRDVLVVGPSLVTNAERPKPSERLGNIEDRIVLGNMHDYVADGDAIESRFRPGAALLRANNFGPVPLMITETGTCTEWQLVKARTPSEKCVSEKAQAKYLPRNLLDKFDENPRNKAFIFELINRAPPAGAESAGGDGWWGWGLLDYQMNRKPGFYAMRNLLQLLSDEGGDFAAGTLDYNLKGAGDRVRQVLLQKRNGTFYVALWQPVRSFDEDRNVGLDSPEIPVTLTLVRPANLSLFRPTPIDGTDPSAALKPVQTAVNASSIELQVPDHVLIVEVAPAKES